MSAHASDMFGTYDFGLDEQAEERAARLHRDSLIVDLTFWGPAGHRHFSPDDQEGLRELFAERGGGPRGLWAVLNERRRAAIDGRFDGYREVYAGTGVTGASMHVDWGSWDIYAESFGITQAQFDHFPWMRKALTAADFRDAKAAGEVAGFIYTQQPGGPLPSLEILDAAWLMGMRLMQLTYNTLSPIGAGCTERTDAGLSNYGVRVVQRMNELGMMVDTAHCGRQTTLDACEVSTAPVCASHTTAQAVWDHPRGKSDHELRELAATGGVVGIVTVPTFVGDYRAGPVTIDTTLDHLCHVAELVGPEHVSIATDWPYELPDWAMTEMFGPVISAAGFTAEQLGDMATKLVGFTDYADYPNITRGLVARGFSDEEIVGILGENFLRVFEKICG